MSEQDRGGRVHTHACDIRPGDAVRIGGEELKIIDRTYPPFTEPRFRVTLADGSTKSLGKLSRVEIVDPDGSVTARVTEINLSYLATGTKDEQR